MRNYFSVQLGQGKTAIKDVIIPVNSRDELPPVLAGLQWIFINTQVRDKILKLIKEKVCCNKRQTGRPGMDLWQILVLGVVRLALDCDYDRLEYIVHYDVLLRQIMGLEPTFNGDFAKGFHQKTISENVCYIDEKLLDQINEIIVNAGHPLFKKKEEKIEAKVDSYVLESNIRFPTDLNLLWDACRSAIRIISKLYKEYNLSGWRKFKDWRKKNKEANANMCKDK